MELHHLSIINGKSIPLTQVFGVLEWQHEEQLTTTAQKSDSSKQGLLEAGYQGD
jgi:hypothetical protein